MSNILTPTLKEKRTGDMANTQNSKNKEKKEATFTLERVAELAEMLSGKVDAAINEVERFNSQTHMIAINARIEASRAGEAGKAFSVVAEQMNDLSGKIGIVNQKMKRESKDAIEELGNLIKIQATNVRGTRLSDLALTNIDLIDRNLFERSCDVRWWATDANVVAAMTKKTKDSYDAVSKSFGMILNSYTVYFDLVLSDLDGKIVANGRTQQYTSAGLDVSGTEWFRSGMATNSGKEFGFQTVSRCPLVNNQLALVYSCAVRENGEPNGKVIGILGIVFDWEDLSQKIMHGTPISDEEKLDTRICIVDNEGLVLADSSGKQLDDTTQFTGRSTLFDKKRGFIIEDYKNDSCCIAHAFSPGYQTYASGWHSLIIQKIKKK
ncbi:MAG: chemotaxis protein [Thaumarchaeota archaeon]|nr:chemotaxis protein [Nitrososphaerota archaeon]MBI3641146.1 chemotaxis protein [Nitrososphaerota archaeon]